MTWIKLRPEMQGTNLRQKEREGNVFPQVFAVLGDLPIYLDIPGCTKMVLSRAF